MDKINGMKLVYTACFLTFLLWFIAAPLLLRVSSPYYILTSIGQISGLLGITLFAVNLIISSRLKGLEVYFGGLDFIYRKHHNFGSIIFILLLLHPFFLSLRYLSFSLRETALFFLPTFSDIPKSLGIMAFLILNFLLILTFYFAIRYHLWKFSHKFLGVVFIIGFFHSVLMPSDITRNLPLKLWIVFISFSAFFAYMYRFYKENFDWNFSYIIKNVRTEGEITEITMRPKEKIFSFRPGQFAFFVFKQPGFSSEDHPFSFTSFPDDKELKIAIKADGDYTEDVKSLKLGSTIRIEGPFGKFYHNPLINKNQIWIAGGIGITPFLSMLSILKNKEIKVHLHWSVSKTNEAIYFAKLEKIKRENSNFDFTLIITDKENRLTVKSIRNRDGNILNKEIYLCGPSKMMRELKKQFVELGVDSKKIHSEEFSL